MRLQKFLNEGINDKGIFKACFLAGHPGSGKGYTIKQIKSGSISPKIVNTDTFVEFYGPGHPWSEIGEKVKKLNKKQLALYLNSLLPLWIDGTSSNPSNLFRRSGILTSYGYDTSMIWVTADLETLLRRNRERWEEDKKRLVDEDFIRESYEKLKKYKTFYKSHFKVFLEIDNNDGKFTDDLILKAYKKMSKFFNEPVKNMVGQDLIKEMKTNGYKYYTDIPRYDMKFIKRLVDTWYIK